MLAGRVHIAKAEQASLTKKTPARILGRKRWAVALAAALMSLGGSSARAADFFDWLGEIPNPNPAPYVTAPTLNDTTAPAVSAYFAAHPGDVHAVKIRAGTVLGGPSLGVYNTYNVKYTFADYEGAAAATEATALVNQIKASTVTGPNVIGGSSYIGNYQIAPFPNDPTRPSPLPTNSGNGSGTEGTIGPNPFWTTTDFRNTGLNMANEQLYPGDSSFRNPINGNSTAPNIRSALFTLPIQRLSIITQNIGAGQPNLPYITRFNNWTNPGFQNTTGTDIFGRTVPGWDTNGTHQLLSRNDFQALALHYRMRGATTYQLLDPGVQGYTRADEQSDAQAGWTNSLVGGVLAGTNGRVAALPNTVTLETGLKTNE